MTVRRRGMRRAILAAVAAALVTALPGPAAASCAAPPPLRAALEDAPTAFVGAVVETTNGDRWATVEVSEVWAGEAGDVVEVRGGPKDPPGPMNVASSGDRTFRTGKTYLFVPSGGEGGVFQDDICSSTRGYTEELDDLRPASAAAPDGPSIADDRGSILWWGVGAAVLGALVALLVRARKHLPVDSGGESPRT